MRRSFASGFVIGNMISIPLWICIIYVVYKLLH